MDQLGLDWNLCLESSRLNYYECLEPRFGTNIQMVPKELLPNGNTFVHQYNNAKHNVSFVQNWNPYIMHFNWMVGREKKLAWIKRANLWYLSDSGKCIFRIELKG